MTLPVPMTLVTVKANGNRYILKDFQQRKVYCFGEVKSVHGSSAMHGPDKVFLRDSVTVGDPIDRTEDVLMELWKQDKDGYTAYLQQLAALEQERQRKLLFDEWVEKEIDWNGRMIYRLTSKAIEHYIAMGRDLFNDNPEIEGGPQYEDMATDMGMYDMELDRRGIKPMGLGTRADFDSPGFRLRESVAEYIFDGVCKTRDEKEKADGREAAPQLH